jgi:hypothetical protein
MRHTVMCLITGFLLAPCAVLSGQEPPPVQPGDRVRVTALGCGLRRFETTVEALRGDALVLPGDPSRSSNPINNCPFASVTRLEVPRGRKSHVLPGLGLGYLVGAVVGAAVSDCEPSSSTQGICEAVPIALGASAGLVIGAIFGALIKTDRWEEVPLDKLRVSLVPQRDGWFALGVSVRF